jgi:tRNA(Arg) A34 adenosine deaminase TadA
MSTTPPPITAQWIRDLYPDSEIVANPLDRMELAIQISETSLAHGGGPFGALVTTPEGRILSAAANTVVPDADSTAHAEVVAIRLAEKSLGHHSLRADHGLELYTSCAPCIMCFGAVWWSGLSTLYWAADAADAEAMGFDEGPVDQKMWESLATKKGVAIYRGFGNVARARAALKQYGSSGQRY